MIEDYLSERQKKKKKRRKYVATVLGFLAAYSVLWVVSWALFQSPIFRVEAITVAGTSEVSPADVVTLLQSAALRDHDMWRSLLGIRSMFIWPSELSSADLAFMPTIASATITRDYFSRTVTITVHERKPFAIWCLMPPVDASGNPKGDEQCFWFDDQGAVFERTFDTQGNSILSVHDYAQHDLGLAQKVLPDLFVGPMLSILDVIKASGIDVKEIAVRDLSLEEVSVTTYDGPTLYFSLRFPADEDEPVLASLMKGPGFGKLEYVDFRVENRAYYK